MGYDASMGGFAAIFMILFWVFVVAGISWVVMTLSSAQRERPGLGGTALRILQERLARGEIDIEEYRNKKAEIESTAR